MARQHPKIIVAMLDMAYNIGPTAFCRSSVARYANAGEWTAACKRISQIYTTAQGVKLKGLVTRRNQESAMCFDGLKGGALMLGFLAGLVTKLPLLGR
uniref:Lysozyme n=1 Tax=uncultured Burkholderia sp. TaxID=188058 RepID=A0A060BZQ7_9BURK|nr:CAZy families GH24 protein [uncultured Burkholderia sp.]